VDYRANANRTILSVIDENNMWMATDKRDDSQIGE
jgi:hypothetical protein